MSATTWHDLVMVRVRSSRWTRAEMDIVRWLLLLALLSVLVPAVVGTTGFSSSENIYVPVAPVMVNTKLVYTLVKEKLAWNAAADSCKRKFPGQGGTLAKIDDLEAFNLILDMLDHAGTRAWIGLHWSSHTDRRWADLNCGIFDQTNFATFGVGQDHYDSDERCYAMDKDYGEWESRDCQDEHYFVCQHLEADTSACGSTVPAKFNHLNSNFYTVPMSPATADTCVDGCDGTQGCFLTWVGQGMCLMGVAETAGSTYAKKRCYGVDQTTSAGSYTDNDDHTPLACTSVSAAQITVSGGTQPINANNEVASCENTTTTTTTTVSIPTTTTITSTEHMTATVTDVTTATTTETSTTVSTVYRVQPPSSLISTVYHTSCTSLVSSYGCITPTPSESRIPATTTIVSTISDCAATTTNANIFTVTATETAIPACSNVAASLQTSSTLTSDPVTSSIQIPTSTTETLPLYATPTISADQHSTENFSFATNIITTTTATVPATTTTNDIITSLVPTPATISNESTTYSIDQATIERLTSSIVKELIIPTHNLSSTRRKKESAPDFRTSSKISGAVACSFIGLVASIMAALDATSLLCVAQKSIKAIFSLL